VAAAQALDPEWLTVTVALDCECWPWSPWQLLTLIADTLRMQRKQPGRRRRCLTQILTMEQIK